MKLKSLWVLIVAGLLLGGCRQKEDEATTLQTPSLPQSNAMAQSHQVVVQEVLQATEYTYLNVKEGSRSFWMAITKAEMKPGDTVSFTGGLEMKNFTSKDLQRTFKTVYFVDAVNSSSAAPSPAQTAMQPHQTKPALEKQAISIEPVEGGITIAQLYAERQSYADRTVVIKGQVTKVNRAIMNRNWIHLQDGTDDDGNFDLTITTSDEANEGEVVVFEGKITLNRDFGAGYAYDVIMENAVRKTE